MAVYVDSANIPFRRMIMCHLIADTLEELHFMADLIGMKREWFQENASFPHYDVSKSSKLKAIENGTILLTRREMAIKMREIRKKHGWRKNHQDWKCGKTSS